MIDKNIIKTALKEDIGSGDITTNAIIPASQKVEAIIRAKEDGEIAGLLIAKEVFYQIDKRIKFSPKVKDGDQVKNGTIIAIVSGPARGILAGERVALNFLQHLSGIATFTRKINDKISKYHVEILDTRKTIPGMRRLEKLAVKLGGGINHRMGLYDAILIKDNHIKIIGGIEKAITAVKKKYRKREPIEVEAKTINEVKQSIQLGADRILLDNMSNQLLKCAVKLCKEAGVKTEASGGANIYNIVSIAKTGIDYISVGALTHSAKVLDISLKIE
ncbi:MAG: nicotinate-nucleotide pyrophosphorylase [Candidatus Saganbacteria bacterium]|uniref:Probable nicotinate-nucleotide pyrophosphorylase [carboxylating] n=1 Tax=Candidatus Saganbacteria bacterium TaxID=2575572 RepID=A0A833L0T9_UNCSA|nr:MAG: nicotinate-nucleotide pyrophosphorylase [Candidatus Saganbacteria bacterium]